MTVADSPKAKGLGFTEFVLMAAALMASGTMAIDAMLPALPAIGAELGVHKENLRQLIMSVYMIGFGVSQLFYGTLSDRFGRRPVLLFSLGGYTLAALASALAGSFMMLLAARLVHGVVAAASRVITVSVIRDRYSGHEMARVMSLAVIVFMMVPILAPSIGQVISWLAGWRWIFGGLSVLSLMLMLWLFLRLPETLAEDQRTQLSFSAIGKAFGKVLTDRLSIGYTVGVLLINGSMMGFINSSQQIFSDVFHQPKLFTTMFALMAGSVVVASYFNSRLVGRLGTRLLSHGALVAFIVINALQLLVIWSGHETMASFVIMRAASMACFALVAGSFGAMAMENMGRIAGTAASVQGCISVVGSALLGMVIGLNFNGTTIPLVLLSLIYGCISIGVVLWVERGRLFRSDHAPSTVPADHMMLD